MELLLEIVFELIAEGSAEVAKNKKISKWIRYPIIVVISLFIIAILGLIGFLGISLLIKNNTNQKIAGIILLTIDIGLIVSNIYNIKKEIKKKKI